MAGGTRPRTRANRSKSRIKNPQLVEHLESRILCSVALSQVPALSSRPGAAVKIYLDFNGEAAQKWGSYNVPATPAYTIDTDVNSFSDAEIAGIRDIWARVSEKYSPFNVDVTTVDPGNWIAGKGVHVVIGGTGTWTGTAGTGGMSYYGNFTTGYANLISWVFGDNFGGNSVTIGEAAAHESGHTFGLFHQAQYNGTTKVTDYYRGDSLRAPIMGNSYFAQRGLWWYGTSKTNTTMQDDLAMLSSVIPYRVDDHSNSTTAGDAFAINGTSVSASGVIEKTSDIDAFTFTTGAGFVSFTGNVNSVAAMLDLKLSLYNSAGALVTTVDTSSLGETLSINLAAGKYTLVVGSHGSYGDIGQYTVTGNIVAPTTPPPSPPAAPTTLAATVSGTQINLTWLDNATNETGYVIQKSTNGGTNFSNVATLAAGTKAWTDTATTAGASYQYRVYATGSGGNSSNSNTITVALPPAVTIPTAPAGVAITAITSAAITFKWNDNANETGYTIQQSTDGTTWTQIATAAANITSFTASGLQPSKTYWLRVLAGNSAGVSPPSAAVSATTSSTASAPSTPTGLNVSATTSTSITIAWNDNTNESIYYIQKSTDNVNWTQEGSTAANVTSYTGSGLTAGKTYYFRVFAANSIGTSSGSPSVSAITPSAAQPSAPTTPTGLKVTATTASTITIAWNDNANETIYYVQRSTDNVNWSQDGSAGANVTSYTTTGLAAGKTYYLRVFAANSTGTSSGSPSVSATTPSAAQASAPTTPTGLKIAATTTSTITITWNDNSNETIYYIQRSTDNVNWTQEGSTAANVTSYTGRGLTAGKTYYFRVFAANPIGFSSGSPSVSATTPLAAQAPLAAESDLINWANKHRGYRGKLHS